MESSNVETFARVISRILGWIYFLAWSISFYPQPLLNWRRRSSTGFTADMAALNVAGFLCYTVSTAAFLFSPTIIHQYAQRNPLAPEPTVRLNDFAFASHGMICTIVMFSQLWHRLWHFTGEASRMSSTAVGILFGSFIGVGIVSLIVWGQNDHTDSATTWAGIDVIYAFSYVKLLITFIKYVPQAWHNYKRKSTVGWAITTILLDSIGGVLSLLQLVIDSSLEADWSGVTGNPVKFGLGIVSLFFDAIFIAQHYFLYSRHEEKNASNRGPTQDDTTPLLG